MKVGTDGILLGAWAAIPENAGSILDVGSGTGLIALQMAQRSPAMTIDGVEIDPDAYQECVENFEGSPWADRLFCYHASFQEFAEEIDETYDLIVTNPPFFKEDIIPADRKRMKARSVRSLSQEELLRGCKKLMTDNGLLNLIYPSRDEEVLINTAENAGLFPDRICHVRNDRSANPSRSLLTFCKTKGPIDQTRLTIRKDNGEYTDQYVELVADFYLKM